jgi:preprotein translocase subunit SecG
MYTITVVFHILACLALILIVLLQTGKGAEMGAAFGGASQTLFGGSGGATFLSKLTTGAAVVFMITCLGLTYLSAGPRTKSVMEDVPIEKTEAPMLPEAKPIQPAPETPATPVTAPQAQTSPAPAAPQAAATQAPQPAKAQEPAKEEKKTPPPPKADEKRPEKAPAGPAGAKKQ